MQLLEQLLAVFPARQVIGDPVQPIERIVLDSRRAGPGTLFVARRGTQHDGLNYVRDAYDRGCRVVLTDRVPAALPADCTLVLADDLAGAVARWSHALYGLPSEHMLVLGVTGTNGKTTTTYLLAQLLSACGMAAGIIGTIGVEFDGESLPTRHTTPEAPELAEYLDWLRRRGAAAVAMEVSSHALWWRRVEGIRFAGAVFTNLTPDHLDFHRTMENYARAKKRLFDMLSADAVAVVNADSQWSPLMVADTPARVVRVGRGYDAEVRITAEELASTGSHWQLVWGDGRSVELSMPLVGAFNVENASLAVVLLAEKGCDCAQLAEGLRSVSAPPGRMERYALPSGAVAVADYAHTPDALERILRQCRKMMPSSGRLLCVFGCGGDRDRAKRPMMGAIAATLADVAIITSDNPRSEDPARIAADIRAGIELVAPDKRRAHIEEILDRRQAIITAVEQAHAGDWIIVAGKGHEEFQLIGSEHIAFSDRQLLSALACGSVSKS
ncbi:MAG: UDP-N-acetylmuramoyl-L-alanyl-D-glutamate--2,6-diaminopimelate ligase [Chlorobi bacterium]|nr:UDP-N-acetylmuramoyl-L-alanyl-D-glutamate--2,6-diaminopimelate ligase [Chlorobiota bacterium]